MMEASTMTDLTIEREILIDAPAEVVWRTITEPEQIAQWFADRVELDLRPGGAGVLVFLPADAEPITAPLVVESVEPPRRFAFRWSHPAGAAPAPGNSVLVELTLTPEGGGRTRLRVVETGLDAIDWTDEDKARYVAEHRSGWATILGRLGARFGA
jgi:uncharacterized protein YndB with AHSA1/START domain